MAPALFNQVRAWRSKSRRSTDKRSGSAGSDADNKRGRYEDRPNVRGRSQSPAQRPVPSTAPVPTGTGRDASGHRSVLDQAHNTNRSSAWGPEQLPVPGADDWKATPRVGYPALPVSGKESQVLDPKGRRLVVVDPKARPLTKKELQQALQRAESQTVVTPVAVVPDGALVPEVRPVARYFEATQQVSSEIQGMAFKALQDRHQELSLGYFEAITDLTLNTIHGIQQAEITRIEGETETKVKDKVAQADKAKASATSSTEYLRRQVKTLTDSNEALNVKFMNVFGVLLSEWDGTEEGAMNLLDKKRQDDLQG